MSRSKHTEAQMIAAIKQLEAGRKAEDVAREFGVSAHTIYAWKAKYGGMDVSEAQEAKRLRDENARLRRLGLARSEAAAPFGSSRSSVETSSALTKRTIISALRRSLPDGTWAHVSFAPLLRRRITIARLFGGKVAYEDVRAL